MMVFCGVFLSVLAFTSTPVFTLGGLYVLEYEFPYCLGMGSLSLIFLSLFVGLSQGGFVGSGGIFMIGLNRGKYLSSLSGLLFSPSYLAPSRTMEFPYFREKY